MTRTIQDLVLYEFAGKDPGLRFSPHCWKARLALAHKGLEAERLPWRLMEKDGIAFSGQGLVPVLVDQGKAISDSWRIALHLEESYADRPSLFGSTAALPICHFINNWADITLGMAVIRVILLDIYNCLHPADQAYFRTSREARFGMPLEAVVADQPARLAEVRKALQPLRHLLKEQDYISGSSPSYVDYCVFGIFMWARCASAVDLLEPQDPVYAWRERLLDAFDGLARSAPTYLSVHSAQGSSRISIS